ncbi:hypothetical protein CTEN210_14040 [Chaetoceros tenuissimus]|uniref:Uncharacterized protein n=1 Tax=Chaetoceros tenuissimus TaxID=426638 RepID=A0AAD3D4F8_9STRA|nr:hypothetical protein CTEN210_14040 [Chaetoceros tenuissimus]
MSGIAGRTNYSDWNKKTNELLSSLEKEEEDEIQASKEALGHGKYAHSEAEAAEKLKAEKVSAVKKQLDKYKEREQGVVQVLSNLFDNDTSSKQTVRVTRQDVDAGKRVLTLSDSSGKSVTESSIIVTQDLTHLQSHMPANSNLAPKSYPNDAENDAPDYNPSQMNGGKGATIYGLIKLTLSNIKNCTVTIKPKVITGLLEISHCENIIVKIESTATIATIQADLSHDVTVQFHDAPSGKNQPHPITGKTSLFWGEDKDDRIFHAGVSKFRIQTYRDGFVDLDTEADYKQDGAKKVGNATAEEVQFVTSVVDGELITERVLRQGSQTGTTVNGAVGASGNSEHDNSGHGARAMTAREMKEVEKRKEQIRQAVDQRLGGIKIVDKEGNEVPKVNNVVAESKTDEEKKDTEDVEELYGSMSSSDIDATVQDCEAQKAKGNEAFMNGEYAQAVLLYTLALDRAAELPDTDDLGAGKKQLFPRHVVLSNRSASFLKLGHHDKALDDATEAERLEPSYVKGVFRKGLSLHAMGRYEEAITSLAAASKIEPKNKQIKQALQFAEVRMHQEMRKRMDR